MLMKNFFHSKKINYSVMYLTFLILAIVSKLYSIDFIYGINLSFYSVFLLLFVRLFGVPVSVVTALGIHALCVIGFDTFVWDMVPILEMLFIGLVAYIRRINNLVLWVLLFWVVIGTPISFLFYEHFVQDISRLKLTVLISMDITNGLFNAVIADMLLAYLPFNYWLQKQSRKKNKFKFSQFIFHTLIAVIIFPFMMNLAFNSWNMYETTKKDVSQIGLSQIQTINNAVKDWSEGDIQRLLLYNPIQQGHLEDIIHRHSTDESYGVIMTDENNRILASSDDSLRIREPFDWEGTNDIIEVSNNFYITLPNMNSTYSDVIMWNRGQFIVMEHASPLPIVTYVTFPISHYQEMVFHYFMEQFRLLVLFVVSVFLLSFIIKRYLVNVLRQLTTTTTDLPMKMQKNEPVEWPQSSVYEIDTLIHNFQQMWSNLNGIFQSSMKLNDKLKKQTDDLIKSEEELHKYAYYDTLTGLPNRKFFQNDLQNLLTKEQYLNEKIAIMFLDLNQFKQINDTLGHAMGDELLVIVSEKLRNVEDKRTKVFRLGGDEFVVLSKARNQEEIEQVGERILSIFTNTIKLNGVSLYVTSSVGVSVYPDDGVELDTLVKYADMAMYDAKEKGRNSLQFFNEAMKEDFTQRMEINNGLGEALEHSQFSLFFQPKIDAVSMEITSMEALLRWKHPKLGSVSPATFISIAEESGLILKVDKWGLLEACKQNKRWQEAGYRKVPIAVNLSAAHFYQDQLLEVIKEVLLESGLEPQYLQIEITESVFKKNIGSVQQTMNEIRSLGVKISIDDFGSGYSSLSHLINLPINEMKLDREFIKEIDLNPKKASMVKVIIDLAHTLGLKVVGEGVEREEELELLQEMKCDEIQGYLISKPVDGNEFVKLFRK
ncbi:EAL domain-containing protein [Evansella sp. AB-P1]|uniref:putative bifunctional diguanylate cyclase/phosphodiesterase n=1 Tax=Evansella sp. AB-P1 TaxID=3037653 RepID=UPI00241CC347|nr:EAL domain-containing protein [Evansella sp. AB-P1]MDG5788003.1 EAL domain-containing protein [Evansella sp. AB-P1]